MDWANVTKIHTSLSPKRYFPPEEHALYKDNFVTGPGMHSRPPRPRSFGADQNESGLWGRECRKRMSKVIANIAKRDRNVLFLFH